MADDKKIIFSMVGVSKTFPPQKQVLKNIYLSFFYGAKIGIIGLNGSGKSTLLKIIAGIEKSYQGDVVLLSVTWNKNRDSILKKRLRKLYRKEYNRFWTYWLSMKL